LELAEIKCNNCGKEILVQKNYIREKMFCTIGCMDSYFANIQSNRRLKSHIILNKMYIGGRNK